MRAAILLFISCLVSAACGAGEPGVRRVQTLHARGDYGDAERAADVELAKSPRDPELWRLKIDAVIRSGQNQRGVLLYMEWHRLRRHYDLVALRAMAVSTLWQALGEREEDVRIEAIEAIERLDVEELYTAAGDRMTDTSERVAAAAAALLARRDERALARALTLWQSQDPAVRATVIRGLGQAHDKGVHDELVAALADASPLVRQAAVQALAPHASGKDRERLADIAQSDAAGTVRASALRALGRERSPEMLTLARAALSDSYLGARLAGLAMLARWPDRSRDILMALAASSDLYVALRASVALRKAGVEPPVRTLEWALRNPSFTVRVAALNALADVALPRVALGYANELARDERIEVRLAAARVLLRLGKSGSAAEIFVQALDAPLDEPRVQAAIDLLRMDDDRGRTALTRLGKSPSAATRRAVARAHRYMDQATLPLVSALGDASAEVRVEAAETLLWLLRR